MARVGDPELSQKKSNARSLQFNSRAETETERDVKQVQNAAKDKGFKFPVLLDVKTISRLKSTVGWDHCLVFFQQR